MIMNMIFCSYLAFTKWLQNHLLTCPLKKLTGFDCPGCGFQRSLIALLKGSFWQSITLYPATIPFIITILFVLFDGRFYFDRKHLVKKTLYLLTGNIMLIAYV